MIIAGNLLIALGEGTFGILVLTGHPRLWQMIALETMTGTGDLVFVREAAESFGGRGARPG